MRRSPRSAISVIALAAIMVLSLPCLSLAGMKEDLSSIKKRLSTWQTALDKAYGTAAKAEKILYGPSSTQKGVVNCTLPQARGFYVQGKTNQNPSGEVFFSPISAAIKESETGLAQIMSLYQVGSNAREVAVNAKAELRLMQLDSSFKKYEKDWDAQSQKATELAIQGDFAARLGGFAGQVKYLQALSRAYGAQALSEFVKEDFVKAPTKSNPNGEIKVFNVTNQKRKDEAQWKFDCEIFYYLQDSVRRMDMKPWLLQQTRYEVEALNQARPSSVAAFFVQLSKDLLREYRAVGNSCFRHFYYYTGLVPSRLSAMNFAPSPGEIWIFPSETNEMGQNVLPRDYWAYTVHTSLGWAYGVDRVWQANSTASAPKGKRPANLNMAPLAGGGGGAAGAASSSSAAAAARPLSIYDRVPPPAQPDYEAVSALLEPDSIYDVVDQPLLNVP